MPENGKAALDQLLQPRVAEDLARFGSAPANGANRAATINYNVPLPGSYSWQRIVPIGFPAETFVEDAARAGTPLDTMGVLEKDAGSGEIRRVDPNRLADLFRRFLPAKAVPAPRLVSYVADVVINPVVNPAPAGRAAEASMGAAAALNALSLDPERVRPRIELRRQAVERDTYLDRLATAEGERVDTGADYTLTMPTPGLGQSVRLTTYDIRKAGIPRLALVETWDLRSFLGDYGLGRTLQTYSLLPGERTTITVNTWRTDTTTMEEATSVFDSSDVASQTRFTDELTEQSGSAFQDQGGWSMSLGVNAKVWAAALVVGGEVSVEAGFASNHQEARQNYSSSVSNTAEEHASQVNNARRQAVEARSTTATEEGRSTTTVREIANTNLRRVLNFVFRELNQTYETYTVLRKLQVAFYNGHPGSAEIVELADLRKLVSKYVVPDSRENVARTILSLAAEALDHTGTPVTTLQVGERPNGHLYEWEDVTFGDDGMIEFGDSVLSPAYSWRFKPGMLASDGDAGNNDRVLGLITSLRNIVLRTDSLVVEALLGQADALDPYASALQSLDLRSRVGDLEWRRAETAKTTAALDLVAEQAAARQVDAFVAMLGDKPEIEVVPVASVNDNG